MGAHEAAERLLDSAVLDRRHGCLSCNLVAALHCNRECVKILIVGAQRLEFLGAVAGALGSEVCGLVETQFGGAVMVM